MKLFVVHATVGGYERGFASSTESHIIAVVDNAELANKIKMWSYHGSVSEVEVNAVPEGFKQFRREVFGDESASDEG
jgi:hypothetical protein